jgi:hypothetical protein
MSYVLVQVMNDLSYKALAADLRRETGVSESLLFVARIPPARKLKRAGPGHCTGGLGNCTYTVQWYGSTDPEYLLVLYLPLYAPGARSPDQTAVTKVPRTLQQRELTTTRVSMEQPVLEGLSRFIIATRIPCWPCSLSHLGPVSGEDVSTGTVHICTGTTRTETPGTTVQTGSQRGSACRRWGGLLLVRA